MAHIGFVDGLSLGLIRGWVIDPDVPRTPLLVHIEAARGAELRKVLADRYRADVHKQGIGDGYCGFAVPAKHFNPSARLRFLCGQPLREFGRFSFRLERRKASTFRRGPLVLRLDRQPAAAGLTGWALNREDLEERRRLHLCANGQILATQSATLYREDSLAEGGDGLHGFSLPPVDTFSGLAIVDASTGTAIDLS